MSRLLRGTLRTVLLDVIAKEGPLYGLEIVREVESRSQGKTVLTAGSLYPALHAFERKGYVTVETRVAPHGGGTVNYYSITEAGKRELEAQVEDARGYLKTLQELLGLLAL